VEDFQEVARGYTSEQARREAERCLQCPKPQCVEGCPVRVDIPGFIKKITSDEPQAAAEVIKITNVLPAICGRVCPQEDQCEARCILAASDEPINIGALERYAGDRARKQEKPSGNLTNPPVAVVGAGPAGLTCAADLLRLGHPVTIFEAFHEPGGVLVYGIPEFRLPKEIVREEIRHLEDMGAKIETNVLVGRTVTIDQLLNEQKFASVFVAAGAGTPWFLGLPGENLPGVYAANEFLTRVNLMRAHRSDYATPLKLGDRVAVIGGGNVALDSARSALRVGASEVLLLYRRDREQMPARKMEVEHAEEEGVEFHFLTNPIRFHPDDQDHLGQIECLQMKLGQPDDSGRPRPLPVEDSNHFYDVDNVIVAVGSRPNRIIGETTEDLETNSDNTIAADESSGATSRPEVFAGGDVVTGSATVIAAMGAGRRAARSIHNYLT